MKNGIVLMPCVAYALPAAMNDEIDPALTEQRLHAEGARLVGNDRHDQLANLLVAQHLRQHPHERHRRRCLATVAALGEFGEELGEGVRLEGFDLDAAGGNESAKLFSPI